ncbi:hypothetical protein [Marinobacterium nitratireducens]|nr:hypothetical protein [Marinobacterium nitratireducens]
MSQRKYPEALVREVLTKRNLGYSLPELVRQYGFCEQTFFRWQARYDTLERELRASCGGSLRPHPESG